MPVAVSDNDSDDENLALDRLRHRPSRLTVWLVTVTGISAFLIGYDIGMISGALILLKEKFGLTYAWQTALIASTVAAGGIFALIARYFSDRFGRKPVILCASFVFTMGSAFAASATSPPMLLAGRIIVGIGIGLTSATAPSYATEAAPLIGRDRLLTLNMLLVAAGQFVGSLIDGFFTLYSGDGWRFMLALGAIPSAIQFISFMMLPESPSWLIAQHRWESAKLVLHRLRDPGSDIDEEFDLLKLTVEEKSRSTSTGSIRSKIADITGQPGLRRALIVGCGLHMIQQFVGINTILYYSATIIQMTGLKDRVIVIWLAAVASAINLLGSVAGLYLVEKIGRRPLTLLSLFGVLSGLVVLAISFQLGAANSPLVTYKKDLPADYSDSTAAVSEICRSQVNCEACIGEDQCGFCYVSAETLTAVSQGSCVDIGEDGYMHAAYGRCLNTTTAVASNIFWTYDACPTSYIWMPIYGLILYLLFYAPGLGPIPWTVNSEIYPASSRDFGYAAATSLNWLCSLIVTSTFLLMAQTLTKYGIFWMYSTAAVVGLIFVYFCVPETQGRHLEEVEGLFSLPWTQTASSALPVEKPVQFVRIRGLNRDGQQESVEDSDSD